VALLKTFSFGNFLQLYVLWEHELSIMYIVVAATEGVAYLAGKA
jgi:hypothetical protein